MSVTQLFMRVSHDMKVYSYPCHYSEQSCVSVYGENEDNKREETIAALKFHEPETTTANNMFGVGRAGRKGKK